MEKLKKYFSQCEAQYTFAPIVMCAVAFLLSLFYPFQDIESKISIQLGIIVFGIPFMGIMQIVRRYRVDGLPYFLSQYVAITNEPEGSSGKPDMPTKRKVAFRFALRDIYKKGPELQVKNLDTVTFIIKHTSIIDASYIDYKKKVDQVKQLDFEDFKMIYGALMYICACNHRKSYGLKKFALIALYDAGVFTEPNPHMYDPKSMGELDALLLRVPQN